jgi:hypothetical protein
MKIGLFPRHLFWSYDPGADLPEEIISEQVILYGDLDDIFKLSTMVPRDTIAKVNRRIATSGRWQRRTHFIDKVILGL